MRTLSTLSLLAALAAGSAPVLGHHGWGGQESGKFELSGTLHKDVSLAGPHGTMQIVDADGKVWDLTLAPPARVERAGLKPGVLPKGAQVSIVGRRNSDPRRLEVKTERVTHDGRNYDIYPDRL
jgi:hypothetical protein